MVAPNGLGQIPRSHERKSALANAIIAYSGNKVACVVRDISIGGAKIEAVLPADIEAPIELKFDQFGDISVDIAWQRNVTHGLKFTSDHSDIAEILMAIAIYDKN